MVDALTGFPFEVRYSSESERIASEIAGRTERAWRWMSDLFAFVPHLRLEVLDEADWARRARQPTYGMPHFGADGTIYVAATYADLFSQLVELTVEDMPDELRVAFHAVYGSPPNVRAFSDLLSLHELAHLYHDQVGFHFGRWWLNELFCNIALEGYVVETDRAARPTLETFPLAASHIRASRMERAAIDDMSAAHGVNYAWYELRLHAAAIDIWSVGGRSLLRGLYDQHRSRPDGSLPLDLEELPPEIARVPRYWSA